LVITCCDKRGYLTSLDEAFNSYLADVERRMRASTLPKWAREDPAAFEQVVVDEVKAHRLTHCLAREIGGDDMRSRLIAWLKRFPDYRRVVASYLFGVGRNAILQELLSTDDRPHVGLVVLLQNLPNKPIRERHEVLKAAYRLPEERVREMLGDPNLDVEELYETVPKEAPEEVAPFGGGGPGGGVPRVELTFEYRDGNTYVGGDTYPVKERLKQLGCRWDGENEVWYATGRRLTEEDVWSDESQASKTSSRKAKQSSGTKTAVPPETIGGRCIELTYERAWTWVYNDVSGLEDKLKSLDFKHSSKRDAWYATRHVEPSEFN
ncbi:MAG: hypothetical protein R6U98_17965, partial [Pirellulaceae bacterium]